MQYNLYGYTSDNPLYAKLRKAYYKLLMITFKNGLVPFTKDDFNKIFQFDPHFNNLRDTNVIPYKQTWLDLEGRILTSLSLNDLVHFTPLINSIIDDVTSAITNQRRSYDLLNQINKQSATGEKLFPDGKKKELLRRIINSPDTDILKLVDVNRELAFLLFDIYEHKSGGTSLESYFSNTEFKSFAYIDRILMRVSELTLSDFYKVNLGGILDKDSLDKLKEHVERVVYEFIHEFNFINYDLVGISFESENLKNLQISAIRALWKTAVLHEGRFLSYGKAGFSGVYDVFKGFYGAHITGSSMMGPSLVNLFLHKLESFILEESPPSITF